MGSNAGAEPATGPMVHQSAAMPLTSCQVAFTSACLRADRACLERARRSQSANGRLRDAVGAGQLCLRGALREALHGLTALMGCERRRATEAYALRLRAVAAGAGSGEDRSLAAHCTSYLLIMTLGVTGRVEIPRRNSLLLSAILRLEAR